MAAGGLEARAGQGATGSGAGVLAGLHVPLVYTKLPLKTMAEAGGPRAGGMMRADYGEGARLVMRLPDGSERDLTGAAFQSACEADVSFDGKRVLFAGKKRAGDKWSIHEIVLETGEARQVTREAGDCRKPIYQSTFFTITEKEPWEQIGFVGTVAGTCNEYGGGEATALYTCKLDGAFVQRITYNVSSDFDAIIMRNGRLVYSSWHRATFDDGERGRIAIEWINVDGSDRAPYVPTGGLRVQHMPCVTPGGKLVFVESEGVEWDGAGSLGMVSTRRPLHTYEKLTEPEQGLFHSPSPLGGNEVLVSWRKGGGDGAGSLGLYGMSLEGKKLELIVDDPNAHEIEGKAVQERPRPDGRSSVVSEEDKTAELYCLDVSTNDLRDPKWLAKGVAKSLRVIEGITECGGKEGDGAIPRAARLSPRRILAEVPVQPDGSFYLKVPANIPLQLQLLDERGMALRSCGWIWARSHQAQGCIGCHEDPELTPENRVPLAIEKAASVVERSEGSKAGTDFLHDVGPLVKEKCGGCHGEGQSAPLLSGGDQGGGERAGLSKLYDVILGHSDPAKGAAGSGGSVHPGRARTSPLVWHLVGRNVSKLWDGEAIRGVAKPLPEGTSPPLTEEEMGLLLRWIDAGAPWDGGRAGSKVISPGSPETSK